MSGITNIHWGLVGEWAWKRRAGHLRALWPEPVDHDECFRAAGFTAFADPDDAWNAAFQALLSRVVDALVALGPIVVTAEEPTVAKLFGLVRKKVVAGPAEILAWACIEDSIQPTCIEAGAPPRVVAVTGDGHPIVWIWTAEADASEWPSILVAVAADLPVVETTLAWGVLVPGVLEGQAQGR